MARVITPGRYSVWFKTPVGEGAGVVEFGPDGTLAGGDSTFAYAGHWTQQGEHFKASLSARRVSPGPPGVFGLDEIDVVVSGRSVDGSSTLCTGFAKQSPGLKLDVELVRIVGDRGEGG
ncbi:MULTISPECIES: hypothetical protein [Bradyrhizobium]|uniref:hypothetical protein n=1 Tax=Bradyrhizobium TaxID=374 RepID=UPI001EDA1AEC|nr:hypothetical protein [Bradyrhizobium zhengyangense]